MSERFSKLSLNDTEEFNNNMKNINNDDISNPSSSNTSPIINSNIKRNGSTSSNYDKINANLHARVKAFQEQRALKRSTSSGANKRKSQERLSNLANNNNNTETDNNLENGELSSSSSSSNSNINKIVNKPLPPLPNLPTRSSSMSSVSSRNSSLQHIEDDLKLDKDLISKNHLENDKIESKKSTSSPIIATIPSYNDLTNNNNNTLDNNNNNLVNQRIRHDHEIENLELNQQNLNTKRHSRIVSPQDFDLNSYQNPVTNNNNNNNNNNTSNNHTTNTTTKTIKTDISANKIEHIPNEKTLLHQERIQHQVQQTTTTTTSITTNTKTQHILSTNTSTQIPQQFNPNRRAPKRPVIANMRAAMQSPEVIGSTNIIQNRPPKQSLSARRGLKLPTGGMSLKMLTKSPPSITTTSVHVDSHEFAASPVNKNHHVLNHSLSTHPPNHNHQLGKKSNPGSLINGIQTTSTSSSIEDRHDTEGTMPDTNNNNSTNSGGSGGSGSGSGGLFSNFSKYVDIKSGSLNFAGKLSLSSKGIDFSNGSSSRITLDELEFLEELGHGNYGNVSKVLHKPTNVVMAMKEVRLELDEAKFRQILMELEVLHKCRSPFIVDFYGAFFIEGAVYMCIEYMDGGSLDKIYDQNPIIGGIDEPQLAYITAAVIRGLRELKEVHNIIHRDVKPTNILCSAQQGTIKLCDFGVSGNLVASMAKTNIGCQSYMAPERIKSLNPDIATYTVQSDIWSLGLSILEMALGRYPYPPETFDNIFSQLSAIVDGPPPRLPPDRFSPEAQEFVSLCLQKRPDRRPTYSKLLEHPWLVKYREIDVGMSQYIKDRLAKQKKLLAENGEKSLPKAIPALHMGGLP